MNIKLLYAVLLLVGVVMLAVGGTLAFNLQAPEPTQLTAEQVISRVQVYGVPAITIFSKPVNPVGQWSTVYEGDGKWRVQGAVVGRYEGKDYYHSTTWIYTHEEIKLILIAGPPPTPPAPRAPTGQVITDEMREAFGK